MCDHVLNLKHLTYLSFNRMKGKFLKFSKIITSPNIQYFVS